MSDVIKNTFKNKVTLAIIIIYSAVIIVCAVMSYLIYQGATKTNKYFFNNPISATYYEVNDQSVINSRLAKLVNSKDYSLKDAYVELNPYKISPLSGVIIFQTGNEEKIRVYINDEYVTTTEASKKHIIPIYGLYEDYENIVKVESSIESQEYIFKTSKSNIVYPLEILSNTQVTDNLYFLTSSDKKQLTGWDNQGRLRFYLADNNAMDVEWLPNNHFLIGTPQGENNNEYLAFVEMDYLGKIYNYYTVKNGVSRELQVLTNGNIMAQGGNTPIIYEHQVIYTLDPRNGHIVKSIDLYDIIKNIDSTFNDKYLSSSSYSSGFYYDENTNDLVIANRDANIIWCINYDKKSINWVLSNPNNPLLSNEIWKNYLLSVDNNTYPIGPSSPQIQNGKLIYFNSGVNNYSINELSASTNANNYKNTRSSGVILNVDKYSNKATHVLTINNNQLSVRDGYTRYYDDGSKIIAYGNSIDTNMLKTKSNILELTTSGIIYEYNNNNEIVFSAKANGSYYRIYKHELYADETNDVSVNQLKQYNSIPRDDIKESSYRKINLDDSLTWSNSVDFTTNSFTTDYEFTDKDKVELYLVNKAGKIFILDYLDNSKYSSRVFNLSLPVGQYALFIKVNGTLYKTNKVYQF